MMGKHLKRGIWEVLSGIFITALAGGMIWAFLTWLDWCVATRKGDFMMALPIGSVTVLGVLFCIGGYLRFCWKRDRKAAQWVGGRRRLLENANACELQVKRLSPTAMLPTIAHPGEDLAYDLYALETVVLLPSTPTKVRTGIAVCQRGYGFLIRDRSLMASRGITVSGGVIDAGYRGGILVVMTNHNSQTPLVICAKDKIAQMIPLPVSTAVIIEVDNLPESARGDKGFGSSDSTDECHRDAESAAAVTLGEMNEDLCREVW